MIDKKIFLISVASLVVAIIFLIGSVYNQKDIQKTIAQENSQYEYAGKTIQRLKSSWQNKPETDKLVNLLSTNPNIVSNDSKGNNYSFEFSFNTPDDFDVVANAILNSNTVIKKLSIKKINQNNAKLFVEFEK